MSNYTNNKSSGILIFIYIILMLALLSGVIFVFRIVGGLNNELTDFYIVIDGAEIRQTDFECAFNVDKEHLVECKYLSSKVLDDKTGYTVKVVPHITNDTNFSYFKNGVSYNYESVKDITDGFNIQKDNTSFTITFTKNDNPITVLQKALQDETITTDEKFDYDFSYYTLVVTSSDGKETYNVNFNINGLIVVDFDSDFVLPDIDNDNVNNELGIFSYGTFKCSLDDPLPNDDYSDWQVLPDEFIQGYSSGILLSFYGEEVSYICSGSYDNDPCYVVCDFGEDGKLLGGYAKFNVVLKRANIFYNEGEFGSGVSFRFTDNTVVTYNTADDYFSSIDLSSYSDKKLRAVEWWVSRSDIRFFGLRKGS